MGIDSVSVAVGAALAASALFICFCFGVVVGYAWRDRISRTRRLRVEQERNLEKLDGALGLALSDVMPTEHSDDHSTDKAVATNATTSDRAIASAIPADNAKMSHAQRRSAVADATFGKRSGLDGKAPKKPELKVVTADQEPEQQRTSTEHPRSPRGRGH